MNPPSSASQNIHSNRHKLQKTEKIPHAQISPAHYGIVLDVRGIETEVRRDYLHDYYVIIAPNRGKRPYDTRDFGRILVETAKSPKLDKNKFVWELKNHRSWLVKVVENKFPALSADNPKAYGKQEIVIDTPLSNTPFAHLPKEQIYNVLLTYQSRTVELYKQTAIKYVLVFRNDGFEAGASLAHAHSQIFALPFVPQKFQHESDFIEAYVKDNNSDPFEDIIAYEKRIKSRLICEDDTFIVFCPYASQWPFEAWIMPKQNFQTLADMKKHHLTHLSNQVKRITKKLTRYRVSYNIYLENGVSSHQRFVVKICGRSNIWGGFEVATGMVINTVPPEAAAKWYRGK